MGRRCISRLIALAVALVLTGGAATAKPMRIVSLNLCTDQVLVDLVEVRRIAALSFLARDANLSAISARARTIHQVRGAAEEVLSLDPDLVLAGTYTTPATVDLLRRLGRNVTVLPIAEIDP